MYSGLNRPLRGTLLVLFSALAVGCHHHSANATSLEPNMGIDAGPQPTAPLLARGDKVLVVINGEKRGSGTYNGERVVLDPPLDTIAAARIDSARIRVGPAMREIYGVSYRMVGVLLVWLRPD